MLSYWILNGLFPLIGGTLHFLGQSTSMPGGLLEANTPCSNDPADQTVYGAVYMTNITTNTGLLLGAVAVLFRGLSAGIPPTPDIDLAWASLGLFANIAEGELRGIGTPTSIRVVPEPSVIALVSLGALLLARRGPGGHFHP